MDSSNNGQNNPSQDEASEYAGKAFASLPSGVRDMLNCRDALGPRPRLTPRTYEATVALPILTVHTHIARLARALLGEGQTCSDINLLFQVAEVLSREYIRFLILRVLEEPRPFGPYQSSLSPSTLIHKLWVSHILETDNYALMCKHLRPGGLLIKPKELKPNSAGMADNLQRTRAVYLRVFKTEAPPRVWSDDISATVATSSPAYDISTARDLIRVRATPAVATTGHADLRKSVANLALDESGAMDESA